ncbi:MAG: tetratricopeptide repeat protein [Cyanobacteria bacterium P01_D01_bin.105]
MRHWQGRQDELVQLERWLRDAALQVVGVKAAGGFGKSALVRKLMEQLQVADDSPFERVLAVTFSQGYAFSLWGRWLMAHFGERVEDSTGDEALAQMAANRLRERACVVVMDNLETLLTAANRRWIDKGYERFLLDWLGEPGHSVVVLTSREEPEIPNNLGRYCRWCDLVGLTVNAGAALLRDLGVRGEHAAMAAFVAEAGGHPLLLKLTAGWLWAEEPEAPRLEYLDRDVDGLNLFEYVGAHRSDPETSVRKILEVTLDRLPAPMRALLPGLSLYRLPFGLDAARVMGADDALSEAELQRLTKRALLQSKKVTLNGERVRLFEFQPLVQRYLRGVAKRARTDGAGHSKAIEYYQQRRQPLGSEDGLAETVPYQEIFHHYCELGEYAQALATIRVQTDEQDRYSSCDMVLQLRGHNAVRLALYERVVAEWHPEGDQALDLRGDALKAMGEVLQFLNRRDEAIENYDQALGLYRQVGSRLGEANTLQAMGEVLQFLKRSSEAIENYDQALGLYRQVGSRLGEANTLRAMGEVLQFLNRRDEAIESYDQALGLYRQVGDRLGEANTLRAMGEVLQFLDRRDEAIENYDQALGIYRQVGDRLGEANTLRAMGRSQDNIAQGIDYLLLAQTLYEQIGALYSQGVNLYYLGGMYTQTQQHSEAVSAYTAAAALGKQINFAPLTQAAEKELNGDT